MNQLNKPAFYLIILLFGLSYKGYCQGEIKYFTGYNTYSNEIPNKKQPKIKSLAIHLQDDKCVFPNEKVNDCFNIKSLIIASNKPAKNDDLFKDNTELYELILDTVYLKKLTNLKTISISDVSIGNIFESLSVLPSLEEITIYQTDLDSISNSINKLINLKSLLLWGNKIHYVSDSISNLDNLKSIGLNNNNFETLPIGFSSLKSLEFISFCNGFDFSIHDVDLLLNQIDFTKIEEQENIKVYLNNLPSLKKLCVSVIDCNDAKILKEKFRGKRIKIYCNSSPFPIY